MTRAARICLFCLAVLFASATSQAQQAMDNTAVLKLHQAGLSDDLIVSTVNASPGHYSLSADEMIALKKAGIGEKVIGAMVQKNAGISASPAATAAPSNAALVDEVGVYYKDKNGVWTPFLPEIVNFKTGGVLKSMATAGIVKGDVNGHLTGGTSKLDLRQPLTILLYVPEGTAPTEYQLLKLRGNADNREFRTVTGGVYHVSSGATRDALEFQATKIAPRTYTFNLPPGTTSGQYGILPPGAQTSSNSASGGKIYTFHLVE